MLPDSRQTEYLYPVPQFDLGQKDVEDFDRELKGFYEHFADCFERSESRDHFYNFMAGQFSKIERKSIEPIAIAIEGGNVRSMQRFVSIAPWDDIKIMTKYRNLVNEDLAHPDGALIFDESGFVKKGDESIGVAKQYCGCLGKVENCQVGVFAAYTSPYGYALIDKQLYLPEKWFSTDYEQRRRKCNLPENTVFKTKPEIAAEMINQIAKEKILPFKYVLADSVYADNPRFVEAVEALVGVTYLLQVPKNTLCWLKHPGTITKQYQYGGQALTKKVLSDRAKEPVAVSTIAENIHQIFWYRKTASEGTKGPITYEFTKRQIVLSQHGLPEKTVWLLIRRTIGDEPIYSFYLSNAPASVRLNTLVWLSGLRWSIEQCFEETKTELGMDHYEVRKFPGWNHHMLTCMLAHFFLWHLKVRLGKKSSSHYAFAA